MESEVNGLLDLMGKITESGEISDLNDIASNEEDREMRIDDVSRDELVGVEFNTSNTLPAIQNLLTANFLDKEILPNEGYLPGQEAKQDDYQQREAIKHGVFNQKSPLAYSGVGEIAGTDKELIPALNNGKGSYRTNHECRLDLEYPIEQNGIHSFDLSQIPDEQKYLKATPSSIKGDDSIRLETTAGKEYCVRLKELEMNEDGEFVMTLKPIQHKMFLDYFQNGVALLRKTVDNREVLNYKNTKGLKGVRDQS